MAETVGFVGVGRMGERMAKRLLVAGYDLVVCDTAADAVDRLVAAGAKKASSAKEVADAAEIVIVSLPTPPIVEAVALGPNGVAEGSKCKIFIDTSTTGSTYAKKIAKGLAAKGIIQVDSPISGGLKGAEMGTLAVMVSADDATYARVEPILKNLGNIFWMGKEAGMGQTMKLVNNLLSAAAMATTSEAMVMAVKAGLDAEQVLDVINAGTGRNSASVDKFPRFVIPRTFSLGFAAALLNKDVRLCLEEADAMGVPMVVGSAIKQMLAVTVGQIGPDADMTDMVKPVEQWAGVEVGKKK